MCIICVINLLLTHQKWLLKDATKDKHILLYRCIYTQTCVYECERELFYKFFLYWLKLLRLFRAIRISIMEIIVAETWRINNGFKKLDAQDIIGWFRQSKSNDNSCFSTKELCHPRSLSEDSGSGQIFYCQISGYLSFWLENNNYHGLVLTGRVQ